MRQCLSLRNGAILVAILLFVAVGIAYAIEIQKGVSGSFAIGRVQTAGETILVWKSLTPAKEPLTQLEFGTGDCGCLRLLRGGPQDHRVGGERRGHTLQTGAGGDRGKCERRFPETGGVLSLLMGPPNGELRPSPRQCHGNQPGRSGALRSWSKAPESTRGVWHRHQLQDNLHCAIQGRGAGPGLQPVDAVHKVRRL